MSRRSNNALGDLLNGLGIIIIFAFAVLWYTNRTKFYIYLPIPLLVIITIYVIVIKNKNHRFDEVNDWHAGRGLIKKLQSMSPTVFEEYIADLYKQLGYTTESVGRAYDGGVDVVATKNQIKHYIQCKKYITSKISVGEVRDFYGAMADKLSDGNGIFITTNIFTTEAKRFAEDKPIELIDGNKLLKLIKSVTGDIEFVAENKQVCPSCGGSLTEKNGKYGKFFGCSNYPKCRFTKKI